MAIWSRSVPGTTTNGGSPTACSTRPWPGRAPDAPLMKPLRMADLDLAGKRVLIREDLNVPLQHGAISSDARIRAALPSIRLALDKSARLIILSHLGRPEEGSADPEYSLAPVAVRL